MMATPIGHSPDKTLATLALSLLGANKKAKGVTKQKTKVIN